MPAHDLNGSLTKILIAEDDEFVQDVLTSALSGNRYDLKICGDGAACLAALSDIPTDLLIMDVDMPKVSGLDVLKAMRDDARMKNVPVMMVTASGSSDVVNEAIQMGVKDFIVKPFSVMDLQRRVAAAVGASRRGNPCEGGPSTANASVDATFYDALGRLHQSDAQFFRSTLASDLLKAYPIRIGSRQLVVLMPRGVSPKDLWQQNGNATLLCFERRDGGWVPVALPEKPKTPSGALDYGDMPVRASA